MIKKLVGAGMVLFATGVAAGAAVLALKTPRKPIYKVKVGDLVQWQSQGVFIFPQPKVVTEVQEYRDGAYVFVDGERTGFPIEQIIVVRQAEQSES